MSQDTSSAVAPAAAGAGQQVTHGSDEQGDAFENLLHETRAFPPTPEFAAGAVVTAAEYEEAGNDHPAFWA
ncbi:hypothetical protein PV768_05435, partial [Pseudarthrobacter sp. CC4]